MILSTVKKSSRRSGFTLIELLVVTAIIIILSTVLLANNSRFGGRVLLENFAYDLALTIRQTQVYGISVSRYGGSGASNFSVGYGMHFDTGSAAQYIQFADVDANGLYTATPPEDVQKYFINRNYLINKVCATKGVNITCASTLDILFKRPEPDAFISIGNASCITTPASCQDSATIQLISPRGDTMTVNVSANGQISISST